MGKKKIIKKYKFFRSNNFSETSQLFSKRVFLYNFLLFYIFKIIKLKFSKVWIYKGRMKKKKRIFLRKFFKKKSSIFKYKLLRKVYFKIFQFSEIIVTFNLVSVFKLKKYFSESHIKDKYNITYCLESFTKNKLFYFQSFFQQQDFVKNWCDTNRVYQFTRNFLFKFMFSDYMLNKFNKKFISLFFVKVKNAWVLSFNFKVRGFSDLVRSDELSDLYASSFKLARKFVFKKIKNIFFILKIKHIRWLQTHINFILDVKANFYFPRFIFFEQKYLKKLFFFKTIFNEYWLAKYLFYSKNNRRWVKFFKLFKPEHYFKKLNEFNLQRLQKLNSTQFNWFVKSQKLSLLKYYYLIKYSKLAFFFFFFLNFF